MGEYMGISRGEQTEQQKENCRLLDELCEWGTAEWAYSPTHLTCRECGADCLWGHDKHAPECKSGVILRGMK